MQHSSSPRRPVGVAASGNATIIVCDDGAVFVPRAGVSPHSPVEWVEVAPVPGSLREATASADGAPPPNARA
jgi:hypothetical protein